jgi:hypothetical protein
MLGYTLCKTAGRQCSLQDGSRMNSIFHSSDVSLFHVVDARLASMKVYTSYVIRRKIRKIKPTSYSACDAVEKTAIDKSFSSHLYSAPLWFDWASALRFDRPSVRSKCGGFHCSTYGASYSPLVVGRLPPGGKGQRAPMLGHLHCRSSGRI